MKVDEDQNCAFVPKINRKSVKLDEKRTMSLLKQLSTPIIDEHEGEVIDDENDAPVSKPGASRCQSAQMPSIYEIKVNNKQSKFMRIEPDKQGNRQLVEIYNDSALK